MYKISAPTCSIPNSRSLARSSASGCIHPSGKMKPTSAALCGIDADASKRREVDDQAAITGAEAGDVVSATTNRHQQIVVTCESSCSGSWN